MRLATRPIPVDRQAIRVCARALVAATLVKMREELLPDDIAWEYKALRSYNHGKGLVVQGPDIQIKHIVSGKSFAVPVYVMPTEKTGRGTNRFVRSAAYVMYDADTRWIQIEFYPDLVGVDLETPAVETEVFSVLLHEATHATEMAYATGTPGRNSDVGPDYVNLPVEVRAYMQQAAEEVREAVVSGVLFETALRDSPTWRRVGPHLTPRNRKTFLKGVYTAVEDDRPSAHRVAAKFSRY